MPVVDADVRNMARFAIGGMNVMAGDSVATAQVRVVVAVAIWEGRARSSRLVKASRSGAFELVISEFVIDELTRTRTHLAPRLKATPGDLADLIDTLGIRAELPRNDAAMLGQASTAGLGAERLARPGLVHRLGRRPACHR